MVDNFMANINNFVKVNIISYIQELYQYPIKLIPLIIDLAIVIFLLVKFIKIMKDSRAWQILKGIAFLLIATFLSSVLHLNILNFILTSFMAYGVIAIIVIFQPELRRALEQLGTNKFTRFFGIDKDIQTKAKEDIYKVVIAVEELAKSKTGALIVMERDIQIKDIIATGIEMQAEVSPQLLVNIFVPKTPLHDGAVVISNNKIAAAACMLPLANDRAAIGMSKESDAIVVVVSEETGRISVAKDGTLIADIKGDVLKRILLKNIVTDRFDEKKQGRMQKLQRFKKSHEKSKEQK